MDNYKIGIFHDIFKFIFLYYIPWFGISEIFISQAGQVEGLSDGAHLSLVDQLGHGAHVNLLCAKQDGPQGPALDTDLPFAPAGIETLGQGDARGRGRPRTGDFDLPAGGVLGGGRFGLGRNVAGDVGLHTDDGISYIKIIAAAAQNQDAADPPLNPPPRRGD